MKRIKILRIVLSYLRVGDVGLREQSGSLKRDSLI